MRTIFRQSVRPSREGGQASVINRISERGMWLCSLLLVSMCLVATNSYASSATPRVKQIETYRTHSCALFRSGEVSCWGSGIGLGNGSLDDSASPVPVAAIDDPHGRLTGVKALASGTTSEYSCALLRSGHVACWGANERAQLGNINTTEVDAEGRPLSTTPVMVRGISGSGYLSDVKQVSVSNNSSCALLKGGRVACWGNNSSGMLGSDEANEVFVNEFGATAISSTPLLVKDLSGSGVLRGVKEIASASNHRCAILRDGQVACWGLSISGSLGEQVDDFEITTTPVIPFPSGPALKQVKQVAPLSASTCVLSRKGTVDCWGGNFFGTLGDGTNIGSETPVAVKPVNGGNGRLRGVKRLRSGGVATMCAELSGKKAACWGLNRRGMFGNGTTENSTVPVSPLDIDGIGTLRNIKEIKPGANTHTCALQTSNKVLCWGPNEFGQLGNGTNEDSLLPVPVTDLR